MNIPIAAKDPDEYAAITANVPLLRWADPTEIAAAKEFLISPDSSCVKGVALSVGGGGIGGSSLKAPTGSAGDINSYTVAMLGTLASPAQGCYSV